MYNKPCRLWADELTSLAHWRWISSFNTSGWLLSDLSLSICINFHLPLLLTNHFPFPRILKHLLFIKALKSVLCKTVHSVLCFKSPKKCWPMSRLINHCEKHQLFTLSQRRYFVLRPKTEWNAYLQDLKHVRTT